MLSPFHALYTAAELNSEMRGKADGSRLIPAFASASVEVYPFQVAAAMFALRSPWLKGAVLADEGSLGKTVEALLVISQMWYEGKERIIIIVPPPLLEQWKRTLETQFSLPFEVVDGENADFKQEAVILTTYDYAVANAEALAEITWDVAVFDEAHRLAKCYEESNRAARLKSAVGGAFKLLITASPMRNSIMDLYGLVYFIDDEAFGDADEFYKRYFRKPENYGELSSRAAYYCFRTLRSQASDYVKIPRRLIVTANVVSTKRERQLAALVESYVKKPDKLAFPKMDEWELTLMFYRALSSSPFALCKLCDNAYGRVAEPELKEIAELSAVIKPDETDKGKALLKALKLAFAELKKRGANRKAIIFTENLATIGFLHVLLSDTYKTLAFDGSKSGDYAVIDKFKDEAEILIASNVAAGGFNLEFCSFVVNFDLPYNTQTLEQRIMRCHRQGQQNDVIVLNFIDKTNIADVRTLELINKRVAQFDGIIGGSDDVVGNFADNAEDGLTEIFKQARHKKDIESAFRENLTVNADNLEPLIENAENALFTTFTREISQKVTVTPKIVRDRTAEINERLWELVKWFFENKSGYSLDEDTRTLRVGITPQKVFTGASLRRREYSMSDKTLTLTSSITQNICNEIFWRGIPDTGTVYVKKLLDFAVEMCYNKVMVSAKGAWGGTSYFTFTGKSGERVLSDKDCREIMALPVVRFEAGLDTYGERDVSKEKQPHFLESLLDTDFFIKRTVIETDDARREELARLTDNARRRKNDLTRDIERLRREAKQDTPAAGIAERVANEKRKATAVRDLKQKEQSVFLDGAAIDAELTRQTAELTADLTAKTKRMFVIKFRSDENGQ